MRPEFGEIMEDFVDETEVDAIGFWQVAGQVHDDFPAASDEAYRALVFEFIREMFDQGFVAVNLGGGKGSIPWPDQDIAHVLDKIDRDWKALNYDPAPCPGYVAWFNITRKQRA